LGQLVLEALDESVQSYSPIHNSGGQVAAPGLLAAAGD
jgi:hypothetical protein